LRRAHGLATGGPLPSGVKEDRMGTTAEQQRCARHRRIVAVEQACRAGDLAAFRAALGDPEGFPNVVLDVDFLGLGARPLDVAIPHGPLGFVQALLDLGADPDAEALDGLPSLHAAIDAPRDDRHALLALLLQHGGDVGRRGANDWTPLHHAVARRDLDAVRLLLAHGADPGARTRIDDLTTPLEDAEAAGFDAAARLMREASGR
jgi:ankyrin repeat protein